MCHDFAIENVEHLLIHCPYFNDDRRSMFKEMVELDNYYEPVIISPLEGNLLTLLGRCESRDDALLLQNSSKIRTPYVFNNCEK